ncbi:MAG: carboxypeptidase regulatory-like domain-containing protein [Thermoanaerobaculia bacterium]
MTNRFLQGAAASLALLAAALPAFGGTVSGRLLDESGKPVAGAKVTWAPYRAEEQKLLDLTRGQEPAPSGEVTTGADGRFRVTLEKPGALSSIRIAMPALFAFIEGPFDSTETTDLEDIQLPAVETVTGKVTDESGKPVAGAKVRLGPLGLFEEDVRFYGEGATGADGGFSVSAPEDARDLTVRATGFAPFRRMRMERKGAGEKINLKRGGTVRGTVLDAAGQPAAGAVVVSGELAAETDASGAYRLAGVPPGSRSVEALWKEDFAARKDAVRVRKGEEREVPLKLVRAASIAGTVIDEKTRRPIGGASVQVSSSSLPNIFGREAGPVARKARTDARGRFRIPGLVAQRYTVRASRDGFLPVSMSSVSAATQSRASLAIALTRAASVSGRVRTPEGQPIAGARVRVFRGDGPMAILNMRNPVASLFRQETVRSRPDGSFRLKQLAASRSVTLEATKEGFAPVKKHGVALKAGETARDVQFVLTRGLQARGRVVDAQGQPVAGAEIRLAPADRSGMPGGIRIVTRMMGQDRPNAVSGRDGAFVVAGLEEGDVTATVTREGFAEKSFSGLSVQSTEANEWAPFTLSPGAAITGVVRDSQGTPVVGASVGAFGEAGGVREATSDLDGSFRLDGYPSERPLMLNVRAEDYAPLQRSVTPPAENVVLVLKTAGILRGRVEDAETKRAITDFSISYSAPRAGGMMLRFGGTNDRAFQSADGSFEMTEVSPGRWVLRGSAPGYRSAEVGPVELGEGETKDGLELSLRKGGTLSGRVLDPRRGTGVPNATVAWQEAASESGSRMAAMIASRFSGGDTSTTTDADGRFSFDGLPDGKVVLTASHPDFLDVTKEVAADSDGVDITLSVGGTISGSVVGRDGRTPLAGAVVSLNALGGSSGMGWMDTEPVRADAGGNFLFEHLRAGRYRVTAESPSGKTPAKEVVLTENQRLDGVLLTVAAGTAVRGTVTGLPDRSRGGLRVSGTARDFNDQTTTDETGRFLLRDVPAGSLAVRVSTAMMSGRTVSKTFEVPEGAAEFPVEIAFEGSSRLAGRITRADRPLAGAFVNASPEPPSTAGGRATAQTDEDGRYALEGLTDGRYQVFVSGQGASYRKVFDVAGDTSGDIDLPSTGISGYVTDAATGDPIEGAGVRAESGGETAVYMMRQSATDSRGYYVLENLDAGAYKIVARKEGYQPKEQSVSLSSSSSELNLALARGAGLALRAVDGQTGLPLRGLTVSAFAGPAAAFMGSVSLDSEGKGEISSLAPGTYTLHVFSQGYAPRTVASVVVPSGPLAVALTPGGRVEVRSEAAVSGRVVDASGSTYLLNPYRTDGRVNPAPPLTVWENFAPGSYQLVVSTPSGDKAYPFTVVEGRTTAIDVR